MGGTRSRWEQLRREQLSRTLLNAELLGPRPVPAAPANGAAQEQVPQPPDLDPELDLEPEQEPAAAGRVLVVAATPAVMSTPAGKKAWKKHLLEAAGKPPFDYRCSDTTIALKVHENGQLSCAVPGCVKAAFGISTTTRAEFSAQKHATLHAKLRKKAAAANPGRSRAAPAGAPSRSLSQVQQPQPPRGVVAGFSSEAELRQLLQLQQQEQQQRQQQQQQQQQQPPQPQPQQQQQPQQRQRQRQRQRQQQACPAASEMSAYELQRAANIAENHRRLVELGLEVEAGPAKKRARRASEQQQQQQEEQLQQARQQQLLEFVGVI